MQTQKIEYEFSLYWESFHNICIYDLTNIEWNTFEYDLRYNTYTHLESQDYLSLKEYDSKSLCNFCYLSLVKNINALFLKKISNIMCQKHIFF